MFLVYFGGGTGKKAWRCYCRRLPAEGIIELLTGSTHGVAIILVSLVEPVGRCCAPDCEAAQFAELYAWPGSCGCVNVFVFQLLYFSHAP